MPMEIRSLHNMIRRHLTAMIPEEAEEATGGNTQILMYLFKHREDEVFQHTIEKAFGITPSTASRVLSLMEKKGFIRRETVARDARLRRIVLTEKSEPLHQALHANLLAMESVLYQGFSPKEKLQLIDYLERMKANLEAKSLEEGDKN